MGLIDIDNELVIPEDLKTIHAGTVRRFHAFYQGFDVTNLSNSDSRMSTLIEMVEKGEPVVLIEKITEDEAENRGIKWYQPDGLETSFIGIVLGFGDRPVHGLFSYKKCIEIISEDVDDDDLDEDRTAYDIAVECLEYNTLGAWLGEKITPFFLDDTDEYND